MTARNGMVSKARAGSCNQPKFANISRREPQLGAAGADPVREFLNLIV